MSISTVQVAERSMGAKGCLNGHGLAMENNCFHVSDSNGGLSVGVGNAERSLLVDDPVVYRPRMLGSGGGGRRRNAHDDELGREVEAAQVKRDHQSVARETTKEVEDEKGVNGKWKEGTGVVRVDGYDSAARQMAENVEDEEEVRRESKKQVNGEEEEEVESMWVRRFDFGRGLPLICVEEEWGAGLGGTVWETAVLLTRCLSCEEVCKRSDFHGKRCIELGAGCGGLSGIAAAHLGFQEVVLTDVQECLYTLANNVKTNCAAQDFEVVVGLPRGGSGDAGDGGVSPSPLSGSDGSAFGAADETSAAPDGRISVPDGAVVDNVGGGANGTTAENGPSPATGSATSFTDCRHSRADHDTRLVEAEKKRGVGGASNSCTTCRSCDADSNGSIDDGISHGQAVDGGKMDVRSPRTVVRVGELDWRYGVDHVEPPFDYIIASDVVYSVAMVDPLISTLRSLSHKATKIFLAHMSRDRRASAALWISVPKYFDCTKISDAVFSGVPGGCGKEAGVFLLQVKG